MGNQTFAILVSAATIAALPGGSATAQAPAEFYKGKTISIIVGSNAGGSYDFYARLMARHLGRHIPGGPGIIVQNMGGAGGLRAANYVFSVAAQDGTAIGALQRAVALTDAMGSPGVQFKAEKFQWLGSMTNEVAILAVMSRTGVASHRDMLTKEVIFGSSGPDGTEYYPSLMKNLFGSKIRIIEGYASAAEIVLALARGEVDGISQSYSGFVDQNPAWPKDGIVKFVVQMALSRHPALPDVPLIMDLVTPENLLPGYDVGEIRQLMEIQLSEASMGRPFTLGPGVPADRVSALRSAFDAMVKDPAVLADAKKSRLEVDATSGATIQELVNKVKQTPRASLDKLAGLIKYNGPRDQTNQPAAPAKK